jgi:hypothetical protein
MRIGKKLFPYPTINNSKINNCFKDTTYALEYEEQEDEENLILKGTHIFINNAKITNLIKNGKAEAVIIVECSATIFRKMYSISFEPIDIKIPLLDLRDQVVISSFIYAKENIEFYKDEDFLEDYDGYSFAIEKYDILAIDDGFTTKIEYDEIEDKKVSSIFSIIKSSDENLRTMKINSGDRKIIIYLPSKQFDYYDNMKRNDNFQNIFFSIITIPALILCLQQLQDENDGIDSIKLNYGWFGSIVNGFKKNHGYELTDDEFEKLDVSELAQELMNYGSVNAIEDFFNIMMKNYMTVGDENE